VVGGVYSSEERRYHVLTVHCPERAIHGQRVSQLLVREGAIVGAEGAGICKAAGVKQACNIPGEERGPKAHAHALTPGPHSSRR